MRVEKIPLDPSDPACYLETYVSDPVGDSLRPAMLVIPGGGYRSVCSDREGEPVALAFLPYGFQGFVLHYSVREKARFPRPLVQAMRAMAWIREHAAEIAVDPERIFAVGFSAGGHLCAALGTLWHLADAAAEAGTVPERVRPRGVIPVYPVISSDETVGHMGTFDNLAGADPEEREKWSLEKRADERAVPMCLIHTADDAAASVRNSLVLAWALSVHGVPFEMHVYQSAPHGMALCNAVTSRGRPAHDDPHNATWVAMAAEWAKKL